MDHAARRARLAEAIEPLGVDAVVVTGVVNVRYLTGFTGSNGQLLLTGPGGVFLTDSRYEEQSRHQVPDLERVQYPRAFHEALAAAARAAGIARLGFEESEVTYRSWRELREALEGIELTPIGEEVRRLRWSKDDEELRLLERAQAITDEAFERVTAKIAEGMTEREVVLELEIAMRSAGAERVGFDTIAAFGENAAEPHHGPTDRRLARGDVVKLDFGCVVEGYHSDMTRTVALGEPGARLREIHGVVLRAHEAGVAAVRAGTAAGEADEAARAVIQEAGYADFFGHSLGHGVGLEVHEGPGLRAGAEDVLPERAVVTVEPGIYLPGVGGVRIEDAVVITAEGCRPLPSSTKDLIVL